MDSVKITEAVSNAESGVDLSDEDYPNFFATKTRQVSNSIATITLGKNPVFVEALCPTTSVEEETNLSIPNDFYLVIDRKRASSC
ncbi:MAG: hypothetical protein ACE5HS_21590 [bacterium]